MSNHNIGSILVPLHFLKQNETGRIQYIYIVGNDEMRLYFSLLDQKYILIYFLLNGRNILATIAYSGKPCIEIDTKNLCILNGSILIPKSSVCFPDTAEVKLPGSLP